jgi:NTE family protein
MFFICSDLTPPVHAPSFAYNAQTTAEGAAMPDVPPSQLAYHATRQHQATDRRTVLVLQGGGALGSYQAGVFQALSENGVAPAWVAGVSIGAINASLIAGNHPGQRTEKLLEFWQRVTSSALPSFGVPTAGVPGWDALGQRMGAASAMMFGQPGFFRPRAPLDWLTPRNAVSYYDTSDLRSTLEELVDFDLINSGATRLSVGAVEVETGNLVYFDSAQQKIGPEHVMASGALPPGFSAVQVDGRDFWDGGLVSNTPLQYVLAEKPRQNSVIFQVDLFPARGAAPTNLDEVTEREKDIRFSSRTRTGTQDAGERQNMRRQVREFLDKLPKELQDDPVARDMRDFACAAEIDVVHLIYRPKVPQGSQKDYQFDRGTMERRWAEGLADARVTLDAAPWRHPAPRDVGFRTFDVTEPHKPHSKEHG